MRGALLLLPSLLLAGLGPASGEGPAPAEERYAHVAQGDHWHWVRLEVGAPALVHAEGEVLGRDARTTAGGLWLLDAEGEVLQRTVAAEWSPILLEARVALPLAGDVGHAETRGAPSLGLRLSAVLDVGHYTLLAVFAGDAPGGPGITGELRLRGDPSVTVGAAATGQEAEVLREYQFDADVQAAVSVPTAAGPLQAVAVHRASTAATVEHSLFGAFSGQAEGALAMAVFSPEGVQDGATHYAFDNAGGGAFQFFLHDFLHAAPPGCATLGCARGGVWLLRADVALP